jgi:hypothetical protein
MFAEEKLYFNPNGQLMGTRIIAVSRRLNENSNIVKQIFYFGNFGIQNESLIL